MVNSFDFERAWLSKFADCLDEVVGTDMRQQVMQGSDTLTDDTGRQVVIDWSRAAMERLETLVEDPIKCRRVMAGCACHYPKANLQDVRHRFQETRDVKAAHGMLQHRFESFLLENLHLDETLVQEVIGRGWGLAGVVQDEQTIIATKIPKSGYLEQYLQESDPEKRRQIYCHCPRIRDVVAGGETLPTIYCYCGAGFYQNLWEEITQAPVEVEVLESILNGDQVCKIAVRLGPY